MVVSMERWKGKVAVVTGASEGIGAAIVQALIEQGLIVVGLARRKEKVLEIPVKIPKNLHALKVDITNEQEIINAFAWIMKSLGPVHVLINNAGLAADGNLTDGSTEAWKRIFDTNVLGLCIATREALKQMEEHKIAGHVVHINSVVGHKQGVNDFPGLSVYPASKFAVTALTETLRQELNAKGSKTKVTSVSPGYVKTGFLKNSGVIHREEMKEMAANMIPGLQSVDIADAVVYVLSTAPHVQVNEVTVEAVQNQ